MQYLDIHKAEATLSDVMSKRAFKELFTISNWRLYSSAAHQDVDWWIDRYLRSHAKIPTILTGPGGKRRLVYATQPLQVIRWRHEGLLGEGVLFANGAVITISSSDGQIKLLFVDETTATAYHYPKNFTKIEGPTQVVFD